MTKSRPAGRRTKAAAGRRGAAPRRKTTLTALHVMTRDPVTVRAETTVAELCDLLQERNINGAPVVDAGGRLLGVVTQEDIIYGAMGHPVHAAGKPAGRPRSGRRVVQILRGGLAEAPDAPPRPGEKPFWTEPSKDDPMGMPVSAIMTSPAISAEEQTPIAELCRIMWSLRIHRVPILKRGRVTGLVSSMDLCRAVLDGTIRL